MKAYFEDLGLLPLPGMEPVMLPPGYQMPNSNGKEEQSQLFD